MKNVRASSLPRFMQCASSALPVETDYSEPTVVTQLGSAVHKVMEAIVKEEDYDPEAIALTYNCDSDELRRLTYYGRQAWEQLSPHFPNPQAELQVRGDVTQGTVDVASVHGDVCRVIDWKSGYIESDATDQITGYLSCLYDSQGMPKADTYTGTIVWLRHGAIDTHQFTGAEIAEWKGKVARQSEKIGTHYSPSESTCRYCPHRLGCDALQDYCRGAASALTATDPKEISPEAIIDLYPKSRVLKQALEAYDRALRVVLQRGQASLGDGKVIRLAERRRKSLDAKKAWPVLVERGFTEDDLAECITMNLTKVTKIAIEDAPRGEKTAVKEELLDALDKEGALKESVFTAIETAKEKSE